MFQLKLTFQLELPFEAEVVPSVRHAGRSAGSASRMGRARRAGREPSRNNLAFEFVPALQEE